MGSDREAWITGIGTANPLGTNYATTAHNLLAGRPGVRAVTRFDVSRSNSHIAGLVDQIPSPAGWDAGDFEKRDRMEQLGLWCAISALQDAGWWGRRSDVRMGLVLGNGGEWLRKWEADRHQGGDVVQHPERETQTIAQFLKNALGLTGPSLTTAAACASGNYALAEGRRWIKRGWVDICLVGAVDLTVSPMGMAAFGNLRALSTKRNHEPEKASRPFDQDRDGFVMAEGGAIFVLEPSSTATQRGARVYAELTGFGASSDASHLVIPSSNPQPMADAIQQAIAEAQIKPEQIDYINAHATSTPLGDAGETRAIRSALSEAASSVAVSSTKGMTGHLICAAAALETIACIAAFEHQAVPPTINLDNLDPECAGLCHVPNTAQTRKVRVALNNSFGFGGSNTCLAMRKIE
jgi:3-oxoacyl-[acyl-carrier-protein] synthase II